MVAMLTLLSGHVVLAILCALLATVVRRSAVSPVQQVAQLTTIFYWGCVLLQTAVLWEPMLTALPTSAQVAQQQYSIIVLPATTTQV